LKERRTISEGMRAHFEKYGIALRKRQTIARRRRTGREPPPPKHPFAKNFFHIPNKAEMKGVGKFSAFSKVIAVKFDGRLIRSSQIKIPN